MKRLYFSRALFLFALVIVAACLLLRVNVPTHHSFTLIQHVVNHSCTGGGTSCVLAVSSTGSGHLIVIGFAATGANTKVITSVSGGGTYTHCTACTASISSPNSAASDISYTLNSSSGATSITVNYTSTGTAFVEMMEYSFSGSSIALDVGNAVNNTTNTLRGGVSLTALTGTNDLLYQVIAAPGVSVTAISGAYTSATDFGTGNAFAVAINTATGTAPTWTFSGNAGSAGSGLAISETSSGGGVVRRRAQVMNK
jgi:hypothetical protein